jgi:hypothetical protein
MKAVQDNVAKDVLLALIKQARDQAITINTGQSEAYGESYLGKIDIIGKEFDMDFMVSAPGNFIEDVEQENFRLNEDTKELKLKIKELNEKLKNCMLA